MKQTSIAVSKKSKKEWMKFKNHKQESFEAMINRISKSQAEEDLELFNKQDILDIKKSISEMKHGEFKTLKQMKIKYNL